MADINELIREIIALFRNEAHRYSISVLTDLDAELPKVMADSVQVQQVMMNLIMNGIDAMKDVDRIRELTIRSRQCGRSTTDDFGKRQWRGVAAAADE